MMSKNREKSAVKTVPKELARFNLIIIIILIPDIWSYIFLSNTNIFFIIFNLPIDGTYLILTHCIRILNE